eukprot:TRINITY_DN5066_c0_g1_i1.p1 TRINITY_DN5066_c0_g1~~TRINITY_DN5066_c0_g1_i1.p1  ORF type:complete len:675 (-),score=140.82 TRINITY_DN5066_c0_g1_i1:60-2084(-)
MSAVERAMHWEQSLRGSREASPGGPAGARRASTSSPPMRYRSQAPPNAVLALRGSVSSPGRRPSTSNSITTQSSSSTTAARSRDFQDKIDTLLSSDGPRTTDELLQAVESALHSDTDTRDASSYGGEAPNYAHEHASEPMEPDFSPRNYSRPPAVVPAPSHTSDDYNAANVQLRREIGDLMEERRNLQNTTDELSTRIVYYEDRVAELETQVKQKQQQQQSSAVGSPHVETEKAQKAFLEAMNQLRLVRDDNARLQEQVLTLDKQLNEALRGAEQLKVERDRLETELRHKATVSNDSDQHEVRVDALSAQLRQTIHDNDSKVKQLMATLNEVQSENQRLQHERQLAETNSRSQYAQVQAAETLALQLHVKELTERLAESERQRQDLLHSLNTSRQSDVELSDVLFANRASTGGISASGLIPPSLNAPTTSPARRDLSSRVSNTPSSRQEDNDQAVYQELASTRVAYHRVVHERDTVLQEMANFKRVNEDLRTLVSANHQAAVQARQELHRRLGLQPTGSAGDDSRVSIVESERDRVNAEYKAQQSQLSQLIHDRDMYKTELDQLRIAFQDLQHSSITSVETMKRFERELRAAEEARNVLQQALLDKDSLLSQVQDAETRIVQNSGVLLDENDLLHQQIRTISTISADLGAVLASPARGSGYQSRVSTTRGSPGR